MSEADECEHFGVGLMAVAHMVRLSSQMSNAVCEQNVRTERLKALFKKGFHLELPQRNALVTEMLRRLYVQGVLVRGLNFFFS